MENTRKIFCNTCKIQTNHILLTTHVRCVSSEEGTTLKLAEWAEYPKEGKICPSINVPLYKTGALFLKKVFGLFLITKLI